MICHKTKPNQTKPSSSLYYHFYSLELFRLISFVVSKNDLSIYIYLLDCYIWIWWNLERKFLLLRVMFKLYVIEDYSSPLVVMPGSFSSRTFWLTLAIYIDNIIHQTKMFQEGMKSHHHHHHHHVVPLAQISLTLSRHFSISFISSGRSSGLHPVSSHSCCMYVLAGRPAFAQPYVGVHSSTSLMSSSLLLQQCPACLVRLIWIVFVMGGRCPYSWCFAGCCRQDLFNIARKNAVSSWQWSCRYCCMDAPLGR